MMKCQACGKNTATTHVKTIINGELTEYSLCPDCAQKMGYGSLMSSFGLNFNSLLGSLFGDSAPAIGTERCSGCGSSFDEIAHSGKVGCAECYHTFYEKLMPSIQRIHGNTRHCGKRPTLEKALRVQPETKMTVPPENLLDKKRKEMQIAIEKQDFEQAAVLRDEIKALQKGDGEQ